MKRRLCLCLTLLLAAFLLLPSLHWRVIGWVSGEDFYQGMPTSYWMGECRQWQERQPGCMITRDWIRRSTWWERQLAASWMIKPPEESSLLQGDPAAAVVLVRLLQDNPPQFNRFPLAGLHEIALHHLDELDPEVRTTVASVLERIIKEGGDDKHIAWHLLRLVDVEALDRIILQLNNAEAAAR